MVEVVQAVKNTWLRKVGKGIGYRERERRKKKESDDGRKEGNEIGIYSVF